MARVWLVRHAPTTRSGLCYGQYDVPVEPEPAEAARRIALRWRREENENPAELWTSPWERTQSLATELARLWQIPWHVDARLSELCFGEWEGREYAELADHDAVRFRHWTLNYEREAPPQGESVLALRARVAAWLGERSSGTATVLAVTHAGVIRTARALTGGVPYSSVVGEVVPHLRLERVL